MTWVSDRSGHIEEFFKATGQPVPGSGHSTGLPLTDIAFIGDQMYGTTFGALYQIDDTTGAAGLVGNYSFNDGINALVGHEGALYAASYTNHDVYKLDPRTGPSIYAVTPYASAGDLAWAGETLYESVRLRGGRDGLYDVTDHHLVGTFRAAGGQTFNDLFGLTDNGHGMFAIAGNDIYQVNLATAHLTHLSNNAASGFGQASGAAWANVG
jgi:hypothetical protein